jgi:hypothetical protein
MLDFIAQYIILFMILPFVYIHSKSKWLDKDYKEFNEAVVNGNWNTAGYKFFYLWLVSTATLAVLSIIAVLLIRFIQYIA